MVDWVADDKPFKLETVDLPDGGFGFEYCCGRSFVVDNVVIERSAADSADENSKKIIESIDAKQKEMAAAIKAKESERGDKPGKISVVFDRSENPPEVYLLSAGTTPRRGKRWSPRRWRRWPIPGLA